ncbi:MAG: threonine--tRNA ligase [Bacilli bacterium]
MINIKDNEKLSIINHSCAHLLAQAVKHLYPGALFWVGPVIDDGFYYDIDLGNDAIKEEDLLKLEKEMKKISKDGKRIYKRIISKEEALDMFKDDPYKINLINNFNKDEEISIYTQGDFTDLCRGPHLESVKELKYFKLLKTSGAYFLGDSKNKMLQRIYGICFSEEKDLNDYLTMLEEAKKRDHKVLGKELGLFMISEYGPGFPIWLNNGMILRKELEDFWYKEHTKEHYKFIKTPIMLSKELWETSGHWFNYKENMYTSYIDDRLFAIKPMNCPGSLLVYKAGIHSYKDFPLRVGELGLVHRHEASGALNGLFRVRCFTQDDAHIYISEDLIESEVVSLINFIDRMYKVFNLEYRIELSTRPLDKFIGKIEVWDKAENALKDALNKMNVDYKINEGDGAFYGPKLDFKVRDSLGREWQCGTIQLDMNLPERFDITYIDKDGSKKRPIMLHRVIYGSIERFIGILIEHYAGAFPLWLSPMQVNIIPVNNSYHSIYSNNIYNELLKANIRVNIDDREEKLGYKIRESELKKINYIIVIGDEEVKNNTISLRTRGNDKFSTYKLDEFIDKILKEINNKE